MISLEMAHKNFVKKLSYIFFSAPIIMFRRIGLTIVNDMRIVTILIIGAYKQVVMNYG